MRAFSYLAPADMHSGWTFDGVDPDSAKVMLTKVEAHLSLLAPEQDEVILQEAGFSHVSLFYAAFTWRGWVAYA